MAAKAGSSPAAPKGPGPATRPRASVMPDRTSAKRERRARRAGRRLRELRLAAGMSQAELAGRRYTHAYVSVLESGRRVPSPTAAEYFAQRLGVPVEQLWSDAGAKRAEQLVDELRATGDDAQKRALLARTIEGLEADHDLPPRVLVRFHRELAEIEASQDPASARRHLLKGLELAGDNDLLLPERARIQAQLARLALQAGHRKEALEYYELSTSLFLALVADNPRLSRKRGRTRERSR